MENPHASFTDTGKTELLLGEKEGSRRVSAETEQDEPSWAG